jgi:hypothetical protein
MLDVIKPTHYKAGKGDVIEFLQNHEVNFSRGNVVKYVVRAGKKDPGTELEDLLKAREYLEREINFVKKSILDKLDDKAVATS